MSRAALLVHGATGFTGRLICAALTDAGLPFAISGRDSTKLAALAAAHAVSETVAFSITDEASVAAAVEGRALVIACAGPFYQVGMPVLAACAKLGVSYIDTTGEQAFVRLAHERHHAEAVRTGACIVPAMGYEIAPADWAAHLASEAVGGAPDHLDIVYIPEVAGGMASATSRGTRKTMLRMTALGDTDAWQYVDGALTRESPAEVVKTFATRGGARTAMSFPSPEAVVTPAHTNARTVRTFMATSAPSAELAHVFRGILPLAARLLEPVAARFLAGGADGPTGEARATPFSVLAEASKGTNVARVTIAGADPYGFTARLAVHAAKTVATSRASGARGVVAPSQAYPPDGILESLGLTVHTRLDRPHP